MKVLIVTPILNDMHLLDEYLTHFDKDVIIVRAIDGEAAVNAFSDDIDLLITDFNIKRDFNHKNNSIENADGDYLCHYLKKCKSSLKVILYTSKSSGWRGNHQFDAIIQYPIHLKEFCNELKKIL